MSNVNNTHHRLMRVQRAVNDLKAGYPVFVTSSGDNSEERTLCIAAETAAQDSLTELRSGRTRDTGDLTLLLSSIRSHAANLSDSPHHQTLRLPDDFFDCIDGYLWETNDLSHIHSSDSLCTVNDHIITLLHIAELLPAAITAKSTGVHANILSVHIDDIARYYDDYTNHLTQVAEAPLTLHHAGNAKIVAFRAFGCPKEHYAIVIGDPEDVPTVRIHSSCYTGDLLSSLACDCKDQLNLAIETIAQQGGGVILYMMQEGRNIGLINKIRAYHLKENKGLDTVDANYSLGYDGDDRQFSASAKMLTLLGYSNVKLLTNNPRKSQGLEAHGIHVTQRISHMTSRHHHNEHYLDTKSKRLGHDL